MNLQAKMLSTALPMLLAVVPAYSADIGNRQKAPALPVFAQLPAVDGVNGKLTGFGGWTGVDRIGLAGFVPVVGSSSNRGMFGGLASVSVPLGQTFGLQVDGLASSYRNQGVFGGAAHLFWRDPAKGLLGAYGSISRHNAFGGLTNSKLGFEAEAYFGRVTLSGVAGWENSNTRAVLVGAIPGFNIIDSFGRKNQFFDKIDLSYYPTDNWKVSVGHRFVGGNHSAAIGTEYLVGFGGGVAASAFVEGRLGSRNNHAVFGGLNIYFGQKDKTLIRRHREDDPANRLIDEMFLGRGKRTQSPVAARLPFPPPPPPPPPPPSPCGPF